MIRAICQQDLLPQIEAHLARHVRILIAASLILSTFVAPTLAQSDSPAVPTDSISIPLVQSAYVASNQPDSNFDGPSLLPLGWSAGGTNEGAERILLQFDPASYLPNNVQIQNAQLSLALADALGDDDSMNIIVRLLDTGWDESTVTWNSHEPDWGPISASSDVGSVPANYSWDVTSIVQGWMAGTNANNGLLLIGDENPTEHERIFYGEGNDPALQPQLLVTYSTCNPGEIPPVAVVVPLPTYSPAKFDVQWTGSDVGGPGISYYDVQVQNVQSNQGWQDWHSQTTQTSKSFSGENGDLYQFRARAVDTCGVAQSYTEAQAQTTVDSQPPQVQLSPLPAQIYTSYFQVIWSGNDALSGIASYTVQYSEDGGAWINWQMETTATSAYFSSGQNGESYTFRVQATDNVGNVSAYVTGQSVTVILTPPPVAITFSPATYVMTNTVEVSWSLTQQQGPPIAWYEVRYQQNWGEWIEWLPQTAQTSARFTGSEGFYNFQARAIDTLGRSQDWSQVTSYALVLDPQGTLDHCYMPGIYDQSANP